MSATRSGVEPDDRDTGSWASETLPLSVRKELLERELSKLGFRKAAGQGAAAHHDSGAQQHEAGGSHPQAESGPDRGHPD